MLSFLHPCNLLNIESCRNKPFQFFYKDVWSTYAVKESKVFPLFTDGPHQFFASLLLWLVFLHLFLEPLMKLKTKPFNYRPILLIFNSFQFTINFVGFLIISLFVTDFGISLWTCKWKPDADLRELLLKMGFVYLLNKVFELLRPALMVFRGFKPHKIDTFNQIIFITLVYQGFLFYPFGMFSWMVLVDTLYQTFVYIYLIFSCTGSKIMRPTKYKSYLPLLNMLKYAAMFAHSVVTFTPDCPGYYYLKVAGLTYNLIGFIFATIYMLNVMDREQDKKKLK